MFIDYLGIYIPKTYIATEQVINDCHLEKPFENEAKRKEILSHYVEQIKLEKVAKSITRSDTEMLETVMVDFFENTNLAPEKIEGIIVVQEANNYQKENIGHYLQYKYKMKNAFVFHLTGNHCLNFELGLKTAKGLMLEQENLSKVLLVSVQKIAQDYQRLLGKYAILGDGAGVALLNKESGRLEYIFSLMSAGGKIAHNNKDIDGNYLFHFKKLTALLKRTFAESGIAKEQIAKIFIPNSNPAIFTSVLEQLNIDKEKIWMENTTTYGHLASLDLMINLEDYRNSAFYQNGEYLLAVGFGVAGNYQTVVFKTK